MKNYRIFFTCVVTAFIKARLPLYHSSLYENKPKSSLPPATVSASLGSSAIFSWDLSFGTSVRFGSIVWGETVTNRDLIMKKYITIVIDRGEAFNSVVNPTLDDTLKFRLSWAGNTSKHSCQIDFILKNVTKLDKTRTYGCTAAADRLDYRSGPIKLAVLCEYEHSQWFIGVKFQPGNLVFIIHSDEWLTLETPV